MSPTRTMREAFYPLVFEREVEDKKPIAIELWGEPLVLFRNANGSISCLRDVCPHRCYPLSKGEVRRGEIECGYHGYRFDGSGQCSHIPAASKKVLPKIAPVASRPVEVRDGIVWVWAAEPTSNTTKVPKAPAFGPDVQWFAAHDDFECHYALLSQNAVDIAHFFLHRRSVALPFPAILGPFHWSDVAWEEERLSASLLLENDSAGLDLSVEVRFPTTIQIQATLKGALHVQAQYNITPRTPSRSRGFSFIGISALGSKMLSHTLLSGFRLLFAKGVSEDKEALLAQQRRIEQGFKPEVATQADRMLLSYEKWRKQRDDGSLWFQPAPKQSGTTHPV